MSYGLYIHIPFCRRKCPYCGFSSIENGEGLMEPYVRAVNSEIDSRRTGVFAGFPGTLYIGGGTPSILPAPLLATVLVNRVERGAECTVEANPESLCGQWLDTLLDAGANRISIGVQSLDDGLLGTLGRLHTAKQAVGTVPLARRAGFGNISVDLMFGIPGQTIEKWMHTLEEAIVLEPEHVSAYSLGIEEDTAYFRAAERGGIDLPPPGLTAEMYLMMRELLERNGYRCYELSNFSRPGYECSHNAGYWNFTPYLGAGAAAHSFDGVRRRWNLTDPRAYCEAAGEGREPLDGEELIDPSTARLERIMLTLRTAEGLSLDEFLSGRPHESDDFLARVESLIGGAYLTVLESGNVALTPRGAVMADEIISDLSAELSDGN
jgi:oxygen-independent coproporphyrinogen III oxidase